MLKMKQVQLDANKKLHIPEEFCSDLNFQVGEKLLLMENGKEMLIRKPGAQSKMMDADWEFWQGIQAYTLRKLWSDEEDRVWESYLTKEELEKLKRGMKP